MGTLEAYQELEQRWSKWLGDTTPHCVACSSGTAALHLGLEALGMPQGTEVAVPEFTMVACARAVTLAGHVPFFVDCDDKLLMDTFKIMNQPNGANGNGSDFRAAMFVHVYGRRQEIPLELPVWFRIEDLAEAHGIRPYPTTDVACWSFYKNKAVAGEEGGMVAFKDKTHADRARSLRSLGFTENHDFLHVPRGHNYRMSNVHARLVLDSLDKFSENTTARRRVEGYYERHIPHEWKMPLRDAVWVYDIKLPRSVDTADVVRELNQNGIAARLGFKCMSEQPEYRREGYKKLQAYDMSRRIIYLPVTPEMAEGNVIWAVACLSKAVGRYL